MMNYHQTQLPKWLDAKESACQCRRHRRLESKSLGLEDLPEETAAHSSILACRIPQTKEPGGLQSLGSHSQTGPSKHAAPNVSARKRLWFCFFPGCEGPKEAGVKVLPFKDTTELAIQPDMLYLGMDICNLLLVTAQGKLQRETSSQPASQMNREIQS